MKLNEVKFLRSISLWTKEIAFDQKKEIIFVWRSNVWKSSLMNALFKKKCYVKTSSRPWKTKTVNMFLVDNKYYFTDLPGYGFAKLGKELREELDGLISWYIEEKKEFIKNVIILIDSKLWAQEIDIYMYKYLLENWLSVSIVLSKIFWQDIFCVSSNKNIWIKELEKKIKDSLK